VRWLEERALDPAEPPVLLATFQDGRHFTAGTAERFARYARTAALVVAFAAESGDGQEERARQKMSSKSADWIVWNDVSKPGIGFESDENEVVLLSSSGKRIEVDRRSKGEVAEKIWDAVSSTLAWKAIPEQA